jgi:transcription initiation factor IIF auxiliary subunit
MIKVFSVDLNTTEPTEAHFFGTKGEVKTHTHDLRVTRTPYIVRQHAVPKMNATVLAAIINGGAPWSVVTVIEVYDGKRKGRTPKVAKAKPEEASENTPEPEPKLCYQCMNHPATAGDRFCSDTCEKQYETEIAEGAADGDSDSDD